MTRHEALLLKERASACLVVGDVTSTMACALASQKLCVPVGHVEEGIRSGDWTMPEETDRLVADAITSKTHRRASGPTAGSMTAVGTYWRTMRHLKMRQIAARVVFRLGARVPARRTAPPLRDRTGEWVRPAQRRRSLVAAERFLFLNRERALDDGGWDPGQEEKLWRYNLHYFDDLNAEGAGQRRDWHVALVRRWIAENPPARGTGWEPYPTSLRVVNWIKWFAGGVHAEAAWIESLAVQVRWLARRIEWHLLGNHLFANAKALLVAGLYFRGPEADRWRRQGATILERELGEQVLGDGGQFERSPMYHLLALEDVLDLLAFIRCFGAPDPASAALGERLADCAARMWSWADVMRFRDGSLPHFNDAADGIAPPHDELARVARSLAVAVPAATDEPIRVLPVSGYARLQWTSARAFLDVACIGPDYLPGHAHADTLSFELEVRGRQLIVNRGTSCYGLSARRAYERSTAAHSTVEIAGRSSSETWSAFRVGRRARPLDLRVTRDAVSCLHDGYRFLPGRPRHHRTWTMLPDGLRVDDFVDGRHEAVARYHLAPGVTIEEVAPGAWRAGVAGSETVRVMVSGAWARLVSTEHALGFGELVPAQTLEVGIKDGRASACWSW